MRAFLLALQFLTVVTVKADLRCDATDLANSRSWYGPVGVLLGLALALVAWALGLLLPQLAQAALIIALWAASTRFLHLDGVADTADALVYVTSRERALEIMKDTRIGAFGLAAVCLVILVKFAALASLPPQRLCAALIAAPALGRACAGLLGGVLPPARPGVGLGGQVAAPGGLGRDLISLGVAMAAAVVAAGGRGLLAAVASLVALLILGWWFRRRIAGVTGDTLGATIELTECAALLAMAAC